MTSTENDQFRALLEATHTFPGPFALTVITMTDDAIAARLRAVLEDGRPRPIAQDHWRTRRSSANRYTSHQVTVHCESADDVIALYVRVRAVSGVVTVL